MTGHLIGAGPVTGAPLVSVMTSDGLKAGEQAYFQRYAALHPDWPRTTPSPREWDWHATTFFDHRYVPRSEFYQDFLLPLGPPYIARGSLLRDRDRNLFLVFNHYRGQPQFQGIKRAALAEWMPHLARWAGQLVQADRLRQATTLGERAVESLEQGLVFDDTARVVHAAAAAQRLLSDRLGPSVGLTPGRSGCAKGMRPLVLTVAKQRQVMRFAMPARGMTPAVRTLLEAVVPGMTVVAYAAQAGIRESTAGSMRGAGRKRPA